jgi:predicted DNA helicase
VLRIGNPARIDENLIAHTLDGQIALHSGGKNLKKMRRQADEFRKMAHKYKRNFGRDEREQRKLLFAEAHKLLDEAKRVEQYIAESVLNQAQVITATLVGTANQAIRNRRFRTVFIDEAGQALEPACWIPILKAERVIFAGDHCQLPPTVKSYEAAKAGLAETLFEKIIQNQAVAVMLQTQYRMHEQIMNFSNRQFYKGQLEAHESVKAHCLADPDDTLAQAVEYIDTAGCGYEEKTNAETSKQNPEEADLLIRHLTTLLTYIQHTQPQILTERFSIGVISPYSAQVNYLTENIRRHPDLQDFQQFIQINSVDGFQGQEKDIIYISLVRSNENSEIGFLSDTRRMNVALTRTRKKLIVIGDSATLASHPFYQSFLGYIEEIGAYKSAWEFVE